jgi:hypothetical protein
MTVEIPVGLAVALEEAKLKLSQGMNKLTEVPAPLPLPVRPRLTFDLQEASKLITRFSLTTNAFDACAYLESLSQSVTILSLYQHYFPKEWANSKSQMLPGAGDLRISTRFGASKLPVAAYSEREIEFFELVEAKTLFPFNYQTHADSMMDGTRSDLIELEYMGLSWEGSEDIGAELEGHRLAWQLFFILWCGDKYDYTANALIELIENEQPSEGPNAGQKYLKALKKAKLGSVHEGKLQALCAPDVIVNRFGPANYPLSYLPLAVQLINVSTGNVFFDCNYWEPQEAYYWSHGISDIDELIAEYKEACEISPKVAALNDWIEEDARNFGKVVKIWNEAKDSRSRGVGLTLVEIEV